MEEYVKDMEQYVKNRDKNRIQSPPNGEGKRRLRDFVIDTKTRERVCMMIIIKM
jgi:hypothetical protein